MAARSGTYLEMRMIAVDSIFAVGSKKERVVGEEMEVRGREQTEHVSSGHQQTDYATQNLSMTRWNWLGSPFVGGVQKNS